MGGPAKPFTSTRDNLYERVWAEPVRTLACELGVSDVALHKACRRHRIPTPPPGHWAKVQHGKSVRRTPLPPLANNEARLEKIIIHGQGSLGPQARRAANAVPASLASVAESPGAKLIDATVAALEKAKPAKDGFINVEGSRYFHVTVRPSSLSRVRPILKGLLATAQANDIGIAAQVGSAELVIGDQTLRFRLEEVTDQVAHEPTEHELKAVAKWETERAATLKRGGFLWQGNPPPIPKWEQRYQGRLVIRLEEVSARSEEHYWGTAQRVTYGDLEKRPVEERVGTIISAALRLAEVKRNNIVIETKHRAIEEERARRHAVEARRAALRAKRDRQVAAISATQADLARLELLLAGLEARTDNAPPVRYGRLLGWLRSERDEKLSSLAPDSLELWLEEQGGFEASDEI